MNHDDVNLGAVYSHMYTPCSLYVIIISHVGFVDDKIALWVKKYICIIADTINGFVPQTNNVCEAMILKLFLNYYLHFRFPFSFSNILAVRIFLFLVEKN